ncbi:hypothetical protein EE612_049884 [Oryza sativa]|nr:hypothetical protein EE612_049884 [Oryza sativa]
MMYPNVEDYLDGIQGCHHLPPTSDKSVGYTTSSALGPPIRVNAS